jgi:magnesium-protoporphyrin O-methyltransferase
MRDTLLGMLPDNLSGSRVLDAGCGTGALAVQAAHRGASVAAVDISPTLVGLAQERLPELIGGGRVAFSVGDMFDAQLGEFDHVVAMDSLIHYRLSDVVSVLAGLAARTRRSIVFTFAPRTPALSLLWVAGRLFPRKDRAPAIEPIAEKALRAALRQQPALAQWRIGRTQRIESAFYKSQALELIRS